jgi:hypothetical protein
VKKVPIICQGLLPMPDALFFLILYTLVLADLIYNYMGTPFILYCLRGAPGTRSEALLRSGTLFFLFKAINRICQIA